MELSTDDGHNCYACLRVLLGALRGRDVTGTSKGRDCYSSEQRRAIVQRSKRNWDKQVQRGHRTIVDVSVSGV